MDKVQPIRRLWPGRLLDNLPTLVVFGFFSYLGLIGEMTSRSTGSRMGPSNGQPDFTQQWDYGWPELYRYHAWEESPQGFVDKGGFFEWFGLLVDVSAILAITATSWGLFALRRRWVRRGQFRLVEVLLLFVVVSLFAAWWRRNAVEAEREHTLKQRFSSVEYAQVEFHGPLWLARLCGRQNLSTFDRIWHVTLDGTRNPTELPRVVDELQRCPFLWLVCSNDGARVVMREITGLKNVARVVVMGFPDADITDADLLQLKAMPSLKSVSLPNTQVTREAIAQMVRAGIEVDSENP